MEKKIFKQSQHSFFDHLAPFLISVSTLHQTVSIFVHEISAPLQSNDKLTFKGSFVSNKHMSFIPYNVLRLVSKDQWPTEIKLIFTDDYIGEKPDTWIESPKNMVSLSISSAFVSYFEYIKEIVKDKYGNDCNHWPEVLNFGRVIRNSFSHKGIINFYKENAPSVKWRNLEYSYNDNGRAVLFNDITPVEVVLLMEEIDLAIQNQNHTQRKIKWNKFIH